MRGSNAGGLLGVWGQTSRIGFRAVLCYAHKRTMREQHDFLNQAEALNPKL